MKRIHLISAVVAALAAGVANADSPAWFAGEGVAASSLDRAHEAFLGRDYPAFTNSIRDVLADPAADTVVRKNALDLLAKVSAETSHLPVDWELPAGVKKIGVKQVRNERPGGVEFDIKLQLTSVAADTISQARLVRFPDNVVMDRRAGVGEWEVEANEGLFDGTLSLESSRAQPEDLYIIQLELKDGTRSEGWFILSDLASSASPRVDAPYVDQIYDHGNPEFRWEDFRSPEYKSHENRFSHVVVGKSFPVAPWWEFAWGLFSDKSAKTSTVVGRDPAGMGVTALTPGDYWVTVEYVEGRSFGPVRLKRASRTSRQIHVRAP